jgi:hypothetical protein
LVFGFPQKAMQELQAAGKVRAIGVSNFTVTHLRELLEAPGTTVTPAVNQVEFHPMIYEAQRPLLEFCRAHGIVLQGYAPLGSTDGVDILLSNPTLNGVAAKRSEATGATVTPAEIALQWAISHGVSVLPKSSRPERIRANAAPALLSTAAAATHSNGAQEPKDEGEERSVAAGVALTPREQGEGAAEAVVAAESVTESGGGGSGSRLMILSADEMAALDAISAPKNKGGDNTEDEKGEAGAGGGPQRFCWDPSDIL